MLRVDIKKVGGHTFLGKEQREKSWGIFYMGSGTKEYEVGGKGGCLGARMGDIKGRGFVHGPSLRLGKGGVFKKKKGNTGIMNGRGPPY